MNLRLRVLIGWSILKQLGIITIKLRISNALRKERKKNRFIDDLEEMGARGIGITGGEPIMRKVEEVYGKLINNYLQEVKIKDRDAIIAPLLIEMELLFRTEMIVKSVNKFSNESHVCFYHKNRCSIKSNGDVLSCAYNDYKPIGNISQQSIKTIWRSKKMRNEKNIMVNTISACKDCEHISYCGVGCRAVAYHTSGQASEKDPYACNQMKIFKETIMPICRKNGFEIIFKEALLGFELR